MLEVLLDMEFLGISIDVNRFKVLSVELHKKVDSLKDDIFSEANMVFNLDSPKQVSEVLYKHLGLSVSNNKNQSTDNDSLLELSATNSIAKSILDYRQLSKILNTYVDSLPLLINPETNRIHTTFNLTNTSTGRLSSTNPNLQNIPIRTDIGKEVRATFITRDGNYTLLSADYSQIELRIVAYLSNEPNLVNAFKDNIDVHSTAASAIFNCPIDNIDANKRRVAKSINFGIMYGLGAYGLSQQLKISRSEADEMIKDYFKKFNVLKEYLTSIVESVRDRGYAETMFGRRRYFPEINSTNFHIRSAAERAAINMPIQGTASDMMKIAMLHIHEMFIHNGLLSKMLLQVHDELLFEV